MSFLQLFTSLRRRQKRFLELERFGFRVSDYYSAFISLLPSACTAHKEISLEV
jgi:hypothetical protein